MRHRFARWRGVATTLWVVGVVGWSAGVVGVEWPWLDSPIGLGS